MQAKLIYRNGTKVLAIAAESDVESMALRAWIAEFQTGSSTIQLNNLKQGFENPDLTSAEGDLSINVPAVAKAPD